MYNRPGKGKTFPLCQQEEQDTRLAQIEKYKMAATMAALQLCTVILSRNSYRDLWALYICSRT